MWFLLGVPAFADAQELTLREAIARAIEHHPALRAEQLTIEAAEAKARFDALAPPMTVGGELENFGGTGDLSGVHSAEATLRLGRIFELGGKRDARLTLGRADVERQRFRADLRRLDLAVDVTRRFVDVLERQALLARSERELALARTLREAVTYRVERAASPESELKLAEIAQMRVELDREHAQHELASARLALAVAFDTLQPDFDRAVGELENLPAVEPIEALRARLEQGAEQRAFALEEAQLDAQQRLAKTLRSPDATTTVGVRRHEALNDQALVFSVSVPFGLSERSSLAQTRIEAERQALEERRRGALLESYRTAFATYQELVHARMEFEKLGDSMIPAAEQAMALTQRGYDEARFSLVQLTQARNLALELARQRVAAAARYHRLLAELERATATLDGTVR